MAGRGNFPPAAPTFQKAARSTYCGTSPICGTLAGCCGITEEVEMKEKTRIQIEFVVTHEAGIKPAKVAKALKSEWFIHAGPGILPLLDGYQGVRYGAGTVTGKRVK